MDKIITTPSKWRELSHHILSMEVGDTLRLPLASHRILQDAAYYAGRQRPDKRWAVTPDLTNLQSVITRVR